MMFDRDDGNYLDCVMRQHCCYSLYVRRFYLKMFCTLCVTFGMNSSLICTQDDDRRIHRYAVVDDGLCFRLPCILTVDRYCCFRDVEWFYR